MPFEVIALNDRRWDEALSKSAAGLFYSTRFCRFRALGSHTDPIMFHYHDKRGDVFDVTTIREISSLPFFSTISQHFSHPPIDIASPEYNGPVVVGDLGEIRELLSAYRAAVDKYCAEHDVVTEFVRVDPMSSVEDALADIVTLIPVSDMVYVDLRSGYEAARSNYSSKRRQELHRAARNGAHMKFVQPDADAILRCTSLYNSSMRRKGAKSVRLFDSEYFVNFFGCVGGDALLVEAFTREALASSTVFLLDRKNVWALYEGTVYDLRDSDANLYKTDRMIAWAVDHGYEYFLLGGGLQPGDGMYTYKARYSKSIKSVRHLRKVHKPDVLEFLMQAKCEYDRSQSRPTRFDYFPSYWLD